MVILSQEATTYLAVSSSPADASISVAGSDMADARDETRRNMTGSAALASAQEALSSPKRRKKAGTPNTPSSEGTLSPVYMGRPSNSKLRAQRVPRTLPPLPLTLYSPVTNPGQLDKAPGQGYKHNSDDSDSELSELGQMPEPPSPLLQAMAARARPQWQLSCKCPGWCNCPKHSTYPNPAPAHLTEWALNGPSTTAPVSAMRSTLRIGSQNGEYPETWSLASKEASTMSTRLLSTLMSARPAKKRKLSPSKAATINETEQARALVQDINTCLPPDAESPGAQSAIERVGTALQRLDQDATYDRLEGDLDDAVNGNPDLMMGFQQLLPQVGRGKGMSALWKARIRKLDWERDEGVLEPPLGWIGGGIRKRRDSKQLAKRSRRERWAFESVMIGR